MQISKDQVEALLWEEESTTLDFKQEQYRFEHAGDEEKSELLKDILTFANAFRRSDAFILIGVKEVKGGRGEVLGVTAQLEDASLQQFVNSKTQRAVEFSYRAMEFDGLPIAVIHIPLQYRPVYLKGGYGKLKKSLVYLRRGSGMVVATPEEIARMGADQPGAAAPEPLLSLFTFDRSTGTLLGNQSSLRSRLLRVPPEKEIPDYTKNRMQFGLSNVNSAYYRELATFTQITHFVQPVSLAIENAGGVSAHDVRLVFQIEDPADQYMFMEESDIPEPPVRQHEIGAFRPMPSIHDHYDVSVGRTANMWRVECSFGKIQPQDTVSLNDDLYVGARESGTLDIEAQIFADNLSRPRTVRLALQFDVDERTVSLDEIEKLERERFFSTPKGKEILAEMHEEANDEDHRDD